MCTSIITKLYQAGGMPSGAAGGMPHPSGGDGGSHGGSGGGKKSQGTHSCSGSTK